MGAASVGALFLTREKLKPDDIGGIALLKPVSPAPSQDLIKGFSPWGISQVNPERGEGREGGEGIALLDLLHPSICLQVGSAFALAASSSLVACACEAGVVRLFAARTLAFKANLPRCACEAGVVRLFAARTLAFKANLPR